MGIRRKYKIIWSAVAASILLIAVWVLSEELIEPPSTTIQAATEAFRQAEQAKAPIYAAERYREAQKWFKSGEAELARQRHRIGPFRSYAAADSLFHKALEKARAATADARTAFGNLKDAAARAIENLDRDIGSRRTKTNQLLADWEIEKLFSKAGMRSEFSHRLYDQGEYEQALIQADSGSQVLDRMDGLTTKKSIDELGKSATWDRWVDETIAGSKRNGSAAIIVDKTAHKLFLYDKGHRLKTYDCDLGYNSSRQKLTAGDGATPEGKYLITRVRKTGSKYYKALLLNYPNDRDRERFRQNKAKGVVSAEAGIGGLIEIHGEGGRNKDWTEGCIALSNADMDHLMKYVREKTPVTIVRRSELQP